FEPAGARAVTPAPLPVHLPVRRALRGAIASCRRRPRRRRGHTLQAAAAQPSPLDRAEPLGTLPLVTLYLSERCNSRCATCDYWRHGQGDMNLEAVAALLPSLARLRTQVVLVSGGEPLLNPQWPAIAEVLRARGLTLWLLTSGLSLAKHAR